MAACVSFSNIDFFFLERASNVEGKEFFHLHFLEKRKLSIAGLSPPASGERFCPPSTPSPRPPQSPTPPGYVRVQGVDSSSGSVWPAGRQKGQAKVLRYPGELGRPEVIRAIATWGSRAPPPVPGSGRSAKLPPPRRIAWAEGAAAPIPGTLACL